MDPLPPGLVIRDATGRAVPEPPHLSAPTGLTAALGEPLGADGVDRCAAMLTDLTGGVAASHDLLAFGRIREWHPV